MKSRSRARPIDELANETTALGLTLFSLATLENDGFSPTFWNDEDTTFPYEGWNYGQELKNLIERCLRFYPNDRITFAGILQYIEGAVEVHGLAAGRREGMPSGDGNDWISPKQVYAQAMSLDALLEEAEEPDHLMQRLNAIRAARP